jgi:Uma2 family endonuclease
MSALAAPVVLKLTPELAGILLSPEEFDAIEDCDELYTYELVHGVLVVAPPPDVGERRPNDRLGYLLQAYQDHHPQGAALDLTLPEHSLRTPDSRRRADRVIWTGLGRIPDTRRDQPTIAIEFVSAGKRDVQRDYLTKRDEYLRAGVLEYWIVDRFRRRMTVVRGGTDAATELVIGEHETYTTPLLPGFELPLAQLLAVADAVKAAERP